MDISKIDINLASGEVDENIEWISSHDERFSVHGVFFSEKDNLYMRVPDEISEATGNSAIRTLARMTSGGRIRFITNSQFIAINASLPAVRPAPHMPLTLTHGFSVYADGLFKKRYSPKTNTLLEVKEFGMEKRICFAEKKEIDETRKERLIEIYFPLYGGVSQLHIGVAPGSIVKKAPDYERKKPLLFYGSSITQGACVSRPGNDYVSMLARKFNSDYINLGFSGNGNAEDAMIDYITSIDASLYAFDYNMYASRKERILPPHFSIYERIREKHPDALILLHDKPGCDFEPDPEREEIIRSTYEKAVKLGDELVCYIPPKALLGEGDRDCCMVDNSHPNDLGAWRMANTIYNTICEKISKIKGAQ